MADPLETLREAVQRNCDISDARFGTEYGLCTYLMKMREYFRWERRLPFSASLPKDEVGDWLVSRENLWSDLSEVDYAPLAIDGQQFDPFDTSGINAALATRGLVYSGGYGYSGKAHFFLGHLERMDKPEGVAIYISGQELARDLTAPPAMSCGQSIFIRRESLRRMLWEKLESWRWSRADNALGRALACYDFEHALETSLDRMADSELNTLLLHEYGECRAGEMLGGEWSGMVLDLTHTPAELMARAVRDHLADCLVTLPTLLEEGKVASLHFMLGNLTSMRKAIFPSLAAAYKDWADSGDDRPLRNVIKAGQKHWAEVAEAMLDLHRQGGCEVSAVIKEYVDRRHL